MNKRQNKKLNMYEVVRDFIQLIDASIIDLMPMMTEYRTALMDKIIAISNYGGTQSANRKGITVDKDYLKNNLIVVATSVSRKVESYAINTNNFVLLKEIKYSAATLNKLPGNATVIACNLIYNYTKAIMPDLAAYGVNDDLLISLRKAIDLFDVSIPKPRTGILTKKVATISLKQLFSATDILLDTQMDASVGIIKDSYPELYINYIISRKLVTPSTHPLAIRCKVVDEQNVPIAGVTATVTETGMVFKTKTKGGFSVKNFAVGTFQFTFARPGYVPQEVPFVVASGSRTDLTIVMVAV